MAPTRIAMTMPMRVLLSLDAEDPAVVADGIDRHGGDGAGEGDDAFVVEVEAVADRPAQPGGDGRADRRDDRLVGVGIGGCGRGHAISPLRSSVRLRSTSPWMP